MTGPELKAWRKAKNMTQLQLADSLGVAENTVSHWEQGVRRIPRWLLKRIEEENDG
jgi:transcriptional regulator with XRE-family HTH domain